jgi:Putative beta barrel porin-7 (BBP7)
MARSWLRGAVFAGWLGLASAASAQFAEPLPGSLPPPPAVPSVPPVPGQEGGLPTPPPPGYPALGAPGPVAGVDPPPHEETLLPNSFSNIFPGEVGRSPRVSIGAEFLYWMTKPRYTPTLLTTGSVNDAVPGAIGQLNTHSIIAFPTDNDHYGGRFSAALWFDQDHTFGLEGNFLLLETTSPSLTIGGDGSDPVKVIARPFINANTGAYDADPVVVPGTQSGTVTITTPRQFYSAEVNARCSVCTDFMLAQRISFLAGARMLSLTDKLFIDATSTDLPGLGAPGNVTWVHDGFTTYDRFFGGQLGIEDEVMIGPLTILYGAKAAVGETKQTLKTQAATAVTDGTTGSVALDPARGLLVQPTNLGRFNAYKFGAMGELEIKASWDFNPNLRFMVGYNFVYWNKVIEAAHQVDPVVNVGAVNGPILGTIARPAPQMNQTSFYAHGLSVGVLLSY